MSSKRSGCWGFQGKLFKDFFHALSFFFEGKLDYLCIEFNFFRFKCFFVQFNLKPLENSLSDLGSGALSTQIRSEVLALDEDGVDGSVDLGGRLDVTERRQ